MDTKYRIICLFCIFTIVFSGTLLSEITLDDLQKPVSKEDEKKAIFFWNGMFEKRNNLVSGYLRFSRNIKFDDIMRPKGVPDDVSPVRNIIVESYFDRDSILFSKKIDNQTFIYLRNSHESVIYDEVTVLRLQPDVMTFDSRAIPFDIINVGLLFGTGFDDSKNSKNWISKLKDLISQESTKITELAYETASIIRITMRSKIPDHQVLNERKFWIDVSQGYALIRRQHSYIFFSDGVEKVSLSNESHISWKNFKYSGGDVWLPVKNIDISYLDNKKGQDILMTYDWNFVNEKIDSTIFSVESMKIPDNIFMVDGRLGEKIIEGQFQNGKLELSGEAALAAIASEAQTATAKRMFRIRMFLISIGLILIAYAVYTKIKKYRATKSKNISETETRS